MSQQRMARRTSRSGFTLLEVLLVVGILALLAAFVVPNLIGRTEEAKIGLASAAVGRSGPIAGQITLFYAHVGRYPETLMDLIEKPSDIDEDEGPIWKGPYIEDPRSFRDPWGHEYQYKQPGDVNQTGYDLWSIGPDNQDGTDDDITNYKKD